MAICKGVDFWELSTVDSLRFLLGLITEAMAEHQGPQKAHEWRQNVMLPEAPDSQPDDPVAASAASYLAALGR